MFGQWDGLNDVVVFVALFTSLSVSSTLFSISSFQDLTLKTFMVCGIPLADYRAAVCLGQNMVYCWWKKSENVSVILKIVPDERTTTYHAFKAHHAELIVWLVSDE